VAVGGFLVEAAPGGGAIDRHTVGCGDASARRGLDPPPGGVNRQVAKIAKVASDLVRKP
jgi:hypothetical protein